MSVGSRLRRLITDPAGNEKPIWSLPTRVFAAQIASRRLTAPSGPGSESIDTPVHEVAASRTSPVESTVMEGAEIGVWAWAVRYVGSRNSSASSAAQPPKRD